MVDKETSLEDVIKSDAWKPYQDDFSKVVELLRRAKINLHISKHIIEFPFAVLQPSLGWQFWQYVENALFDSTLLTLSTSISESPNDHYSLENFYRRMQNSYLKRDTSDRIMADFATSHLAYRVQVKIVRPEIKSIRDKHIAHRDRNAESVTLHQMEYKKLSNAQNAAQVFLERLTFSSIILDWDYEPRPYAKNYFSDVEQLLGYVANTSLYVRNYSEDYRRKMQADSYAELSNEERLIVEVWRKRVKDMDICDNEQ